MIDHKLTPRMLYSNFLAFIAVSLASCTSSKWQDTPVQISAKSPLNVALDQEIEWSFEAARGSRKLRIIDISYNNLPLGVLKSNTGDSIIIKGKPLSREIRAGLIEVIAFDEKACNEGYEQMKEMATKEVKATGDTNITLPKSPCKLTGGSDFSNALAYMAKAQFAWQFVDGPDALDSEKYPEFVAEHIFKTPRALPEGMLEIRGNEAPQTVDATLGECAALPRKQCGKDSDCLWGMTSCISKSVTGRKASTLGLTGSAESGVVIVPQEGIKQ